MPKQRNHPHLHRRRGVSRYGLQLPTYNVFSRFEGISPRYPEGWVPRRVPPLYLYLFGGLAAAIVVVMLLAVVFVSLLGRGPHPQPLPRQGGRGEPDGVSALAEHAPRASA